MDVILASQSPRRRELLALLQIPFDVEVSGEKEIIPEDACPEQIVMALAEQKAQHVFLRHPNHCVIGADTIVVLDDHILGKPKTAAQAVEYLSALQGKNHYVLTGVCVKTPHGSLTLAYSPPFSKSWLCVPSSVIRPSCKKSTRSQNCVEASR